MYDTVKAGLPAYWSSMAYAFEVTGPLVASVGGRRYLTWTVTETEVSPADEYQVPGLPTFCTLTLFEAVLDQPGNTLVIAPELGLTPGWQPGSLDEVARVEAPAASFRIQCAARITSPNQKLVGRSKPDSGPAARIVTRLTVIEGHL